MTGNSTGPRGRGFHRASKRWLKISTILGICLVPIVAFSQTTYTYDELGRLKSTTRTVSGTTYSTSYSYDPADNRVQTAVTRNNAVPVAVNDAVSTAYATTTSPAILPLTNDTDANGDTLSVTAVGAATHGTSTKTSATQVTYTPANGFYGTDPFSYTISDGFGGSTSANITVTVAAPAAAINADRLLSGQGLTAGTHLTSPNGLYHIDMQGDGNLVLYGPNGSLWNSNTANNLANLAVMQTAGNLVVYNHNTATSYWNSATSGSSAYFRLQNDGNLVVYSSSGTALWNSATNNHAPVATSDNVTTGVNTALANFNPRGNDTDADADPLTISAITQPSHGIVTKTTTTVTYTPTTNYSGTDSFTYTINDGRGGTSTATITVTVQGQLSINVTSAANLRTLANNAGYTGAAGANYQFVVASGVTVTGPAAGGKSIDTGTWPSDATLSLVISGNVYGGGGTGGAGNNFGSGNPGGAGGDAIYAQAPITITVNSGATIKSGGGGGGGGSYQSFTGMGGGTVGGDGGGGGFPNGLGGAGSTGTYADPVAPGSPGTTSGGGAGGTGGPPGGAGGASGTAGSSGAASTNPGGAGGAAGYAIRKNGKTVTVTNNGNVTGTIG